MVVTESNQCGTESPKITKEVIAVRRIADGFHEQDWLELQKDLGGDNTAK